VSSLRSEMAMSHSCISRSIARSAGSRAAAIAHALLSDGFFTPRESFLNQPTSPPPPLFLVSALAISFVAAASNAS